MQSWQLRYSSEGRTALFPAEARRRRVVRTLVRIAGPWMVSFSIADEHVHLIVLCDEDRVGRLRRNVSLALGAATPEPLDPSWAKAFRSRQHLHGTFDYLLTQVDHHGLPAHPALWSGSVFQDLIGARALEDLQLQLHEALPRYRLRHALAAVGLPPEPIEPAGDPRIRSAGLERLAFAAAAAACVDPTLAGRTPAVVAAKTAVAHLAATAGWSTGDTARTLSMAQRSVRNCLARPADDRLVLATRVRLSLEDVVAITR